MKSYERKCICCGSSYQYCPNCGKFNGKPKWMISYDEESCKDLFNAVSGYNMGVVTKEQLKAVLDKHNITDYSKYKDSIKNLLTELFSAPEPEEVEYRSKKNKFYTKPKEKDIELVESEIPE